MTAAAQRAAEAILDATYDGMSLADEWRASARLIDAEFAPLVEAVTALLDFTSPGEYRRVRAAFARVKGDPKEGE